MQQIYLNTGFVDLSTLWDAVLGSGDGGGLGYEDFGYTSVGPCLVLSDSMVGSCEDPEHTFYWFPG
jgi:hypothetical protein